jgi:hypothetical protein
VLRHTSIQIVAAGEITTELTPDGAEGQMAGYVRNPSRKFNLRTYVSKLPTAPITT